MIRTENGAMPGCSAAFSHSKLLAARFLTVTAGVTVLIGGLAWSGPAQAQAPQTADQTMAELESIFWQCDYAATQSVLSVGLAQTCVVVGDTLKQRKFNGDFSQMIAWWRQHKTAAHLALAKTSPQPETDLAAAGRR